MLRGCNEICLHVDMVIEAGIDVSCLDRPEGKEISVCLLLLRLVLLITVGTVGR